MNSVRPLLSRASSSQASSSFWFQRDTKVAMETVRQGRQTSTGLKKQLIRSIYVIDFEATCNGNQQEPLKPQEIIEFPCVKVDTRTFKKVATFHEYVRPVQHPNLTHFCTDLTGIVQETVESADDFVQVFARFQAWLEDNQFDHDGGEDAFLTMGDWDFKTMLPSQCALSGVHLPKSFHRWINIKRSYESCMGYFPRSMVHILDTLDIPLVGRHHSGIDDVNNMVSIVQKLALEKGCVYNITGKLKMPPTVQ